MLAWRQNKRRLTLQCPLGTFWAEMPEGWRLSAVHPSALAVAEHLLLHNVPAAANALPPIDELLARRPRPSPPASRPLLCYSAGCDSTAALQLLPPETIPIYCRRPYATYRHPKGAAIRLAPFEPIARCLDAVGEKLRQPVVRVPSTFETIGLSAGLRHGFTDGYGYGVMACLLADHFDAGAVAFGSVMEQVFLGSGHNYTDIVAYPSAKFHFYRRLFQIAGLEFMLPTGGCSEVLTAAIVARGPLAGLDVSCPLADADGTPCGRCFKCFRKLRLQSQIPNPQFLPPPTPSVMATLEKRPLKSASSVIYACQRSGWWTDSLREYQNVRLDFLDRHHGYAVDHLLPSHLSKHVHQRFRELGIDPMNVDDEHRLRTLGKTFHPKAYEQTRAGFPTEAPDTQSLA